MSDLSLLLSARANETIDEKVTKKSAGAYALGKMYDTTFIVYYVGRSDDDIKGRLKKWVGGK